MQVLVSSAAEPEGREHGSKEKQDGRTDREHGEVGWFTRVVERKQCYGRKLRIIPAVSTPL